MHDIKKELGYSRPYLRDGVPGMPIERQREILAAAGIDVSDDRTLYVDRLTKAAIKRRDTSVLKERTDALNPRRPGETICVAGLRVFDWTMSGAARCLLAAFTREATVFCADTGLLLSVDMPALALLEALAGAEEAYRRGVVQERQHRATTAAQKAKARRKAQRLAIARPKWKDREFTVDQISEESGLSRRTLYSELGPRWESMQHA